MPKFVLLSFHDGEVVVRALQPAVRLSNDDDGGSRRAGHTSLLSDSGVLVRSRNTYRRHVFLWREAVALNDETRTSTSTYATCWG